MYGNLSTDPMLYKSIAAIQSARGLLKASLLRSVTYSVGIHALVCGLRANALSESCLLSASQLIAMQSR